MALIPPFFLDCVVAIGVENRQGINWVGTGFLVGRPCDGENEEKKYNTFIVTNKHVLDNKEKIIIRFNKKDNDGTKDYPITIIKDGVETWTRHPTNEVDVAALFVNPTVLKEDLTHFAFFNLDEHIINVVQMQEEGVSEGDNIYVLGFPMGNVTENENYVICRTGIISRLRDVIRGTKKSYLIDSNIFPGNSGGPVIVRPEAMSIQNTKSLQRAALIGVVKSYLPYRDVAISQQTGTAKVIFEENSGLAFVETVDSINETVEICFNQTFPNNTP